MGLSTYIDLYIAGRNLYEEIMFIHIDQQSVFFLSLSPKHANECWYLSGNSIYE